MTHITRRDALKTITASVPALLAALFMPWKSGAAMQALSQQLEATGQTASLYIDTLSTARISRFKGQILAHATPMEVLSRHGRQVKMLKPRPGQIARVGNGTYIAKRYSPFSKGQKSQIRRRQ